LTILQFCVELCAMKINIGKAAKELGVAQETLRRWERLGKIEVERTPKGHRRYDLAKLKKGSLKQQNLHLRTIAYARVSSHDQKKDLVRQVELLESFCVSHGWTYEIFQDLGSGLNYSKKGLKKLIKEICFGTVNRLVLTHKDRLLRACFQIEAPSGQRQSPLVESKKTG
jgi:putative resolvase